MCQALNKKGYRCGLEHTKALCFIHKKAQLQDQLKAEIEQLKPDAIAYKLITQNHSRVKQVTKVVYKPTEASTAERSKWRTAMAQVVELEAKLLKASKHEDQLRAVIQGMTPDYQAYQLIKRYESKRVELERKKIDPMSHCDRDFHRLRKQRNRVAHAIA